MASKLRARTRGKPTHAKAKAAQRAGDVKRAKKEGARDTSGPTAAELMSKGVDRGLAEGVVNKARKDAAVAADRATGKFSGMPASTTPSGFVDIGGGAGQIDRGLAAAAGLVQGDPWKSTSGWTADTGGISDILDLISVLGESGIDTTTGKIISGVDTTVDGDKVDTTTDGDKTEKDKEEEKKFFIKGVGMVDKRLNDYYQGLLKRMEHKEAIDRVKLKQMEDDWAEKNLQTLTERLSEKGPLGLPLGPLGILKGALTKQPYEKEFLGSAGAANILNQLNKITDPKERQEYVNRILAANKGAEEIFGQPAAAGTQINPSEFEQGLVAANQGNKNFDMNYHKTVGAYWDVNTPQTQGDQESMATAFQQGNLKMTKANTLAIQQAVDAKSRMGDVTGRQALQDSQRQPTDPTDPTDPDKPYGNLTFDVYGRPITNYDYTGGPEQLYLGGGWKKDGVYAGYPWGPHTFKEGGIANFKPYGY